MERNDMEFRTKIPIAGQEPKIDYNSKIFMLGSCFVGNIGGKLDYYKFQNYRNPFGILFHPVAIENFLERVVSRYKYSDEDVFFHQERWHCFDAHSELSNPNKKNLIRNLNSGVRKSGKFLNSATHVVITLGTAWGYRQVDLDRTVANCHKISQKEFQKELMMVDDIRQSLLKILSYLHMINSKVSVIFNISPVRHTKDGFTENQWSKSNLMAALQQCLGEFQQNEEWKKTLSYFPSYEIVMDELRDYRFYAEDMIHPSSTAVDYIWSRFDDVWINQNTAETKNEVEKIQRALNHRPFNGKSKEHQKFKDKLQARINKLESRVPHIKFAKPK
ncbi:GSCFA domain-containing protein [Salegentibacter sp. F188]|uniref:GSCFA domain-containing protein n=1 Tax=Autumnicola patrickiae TaxID=3075591 RepID=A0ABU3E544_9FLAO|nr:GSCFA domain-containing protein [Salegentibacter sp. F188]MDT0691115.1 GSCFA domain-containing protein [Salegentibacter sp. F188]